MDEETIPPDHPRYWSLVIRERLVRGFRNGIVVPQGLIAHGRGEAFDYILGEETHPPAREATKAAAALLLVSQNPVISVNGNSAALAASELVKLSQISNAKLEVNLFHRSREREERILSRLREEGADNILGVGEDADAIIPDISSMRRKVSSRGIYRADTVLVAIEDGDRTESLVKMGKKVIAIDINPFSRTARYATVTIVDNIIRAIPNLVKECEELRHLSLEEIRCIAERFDNEANLCNMVAIILRRLEKIAQQGF